MAHLEELFLKKELIPFIKNMLTPLLDNFQGKLSLTVSYDKDAGVQVSKTSPVRANEIKEQKPIPVGIFSDECYFIRSGVVEAVAKIDGNETIVLKGSKVITESKISVKNPEVRAAELRKIAKNCGDYCILEEDIAFNSVSTAAVFCLGRSANGWREWKDKNGNLIERK